MSGRKNLKAVLAGGAGALALMTAGMAAAQTRDYDVPAGDLIVALDAYARQSGVQIIYKVTDEIRAAMAGMLEPTFKDARIDMAEVREVFKTPKSGTVAGCMVTEGVIRRSGDAQARLLREGAVVHTGKLSSLRRFKDDVSEVKNGLECGMTFERFNDIKVGDIIEVFVSEEIAVTIPG